MQAKNGTGATSPCKAVPAPTCRDRRHGMAPSTSLPKDEEQARPKAQWKARHRSFQIWSAHCVTEIDSVTILIKWLRPCRRLLEFNYKFGSNSGGGRRGAAPPRTPGPPQKALRALGCSGWSLFRDRATCPGQLRCQGQNSFSKIRLVFRTSHLSGAAALPGADFFSKFRFV